MPVNELKTSDLRLAVNMLIDHLENDLNIKAIKLDKDFYWDALPEDFFKTDIKPQLTMGSLKDDIEFLQSMISNSGSEYAPSLMFMHVAPLMLYISQRIGA